MYKNYILSISLIASSFFTLFTACNESQAQDVNLGSKTYTLSGQSGNFPLDSQFRSSSDGSRPLKYEIVSKSDPANVLSSASISSGTLSVASRGVSGTATLTVRAIPERFPVFDNVNIPENPMPTKPGAPVRYTVAAGMTPSQILTHYAFFTYNPVTETYDTTKLNEEQLKWVLRNHVNDNDPLVLDIETYQYFGNDEVGRNNLARVLTIVRQERPNVKFLGYYLLFPMRSWYEAVNLRRAERDKALGLPSWYATHHEKFIADYNTWAYKNSLYRTAPVSAFAGGGTVAQKISAVYPSLYTVVRDTVGEDIEVTYNSSSGFFNAKSCGFQNGNEIRVVPSNGATLPSPLSRWVPYYVVNSSTDNLTFQIAASPGGAPIKLGSNFSSKTYMSRSSTGRTLCQDRDMVDWVTYARENISEARKFGVPVYAYISPRFRGSTGSLIDATLFKIQLETLRDLVDGIVIWDEVSESQAVRTSREWWKEMTIFLAAQKPRIMTISISVNATVPSTPKIIGDVNGDNIVNGDDYVACSTGRATVGCDINGDGKFDTNDVIQFLKTMSILSMPGDFDRNGKITSSDVANCEANLGKAITNTNQLCDFDRNNSINSTDISLIRSVMGRILGDLDNTLTVDSSDIISCFSNYTGGLKANVTYASCDIDGDKDVDNLDLGTVLAVAYRGCGNVTGVCSTTSASLTTRAVSSSTKSKVAWKKDLKNKRVLKKIHKKVKKLKSV